MRARNRTKASIIPKIEIPPIERPSEEELARRRHVYDRVMKLRAKMKPLGISTAELIRQMREEEELSG